MAQSKHIRAANATISIIDDDESMRTSVAGLVRSVGWKALVYATAEEFIASGTCLDADCVVTDIQMPGLSGFDLKDWLMDHCSAAPVIMITARSEKHLRAQALASGAFCFLEKPFAPSTLLACIEKALSSPPNMT
jgi:FixJ family two-component response regulator